MGSNDEFVMRSRVGLFLFLFEDEFRTSAPCLGDIGLFIFWWWRHN